MRTRGLGFGAARGLGCGSQPALEKLLIPLELPLHKGQRRRVFVRRDRHHRPDGPRAGCSSPVRRRRPTANRRRLGSHTPSAAAPAACPAAAPAATRQQAEPLQFLCLSQLESQRQYLRVFLLTRALQLYRHLVLDVGLLHLKREQLHLFPYCHSQALGVLCVTHRERLGLLHRVGAVRGAQPGQIPSQRGDLPHELGVTFGQLGSERRECNVFGTLLGECLELGIKFAKL
mmetsp:Transcript_26323/g.65944  ORF Transcript_26323/g.65944 Transcript_26323/m.65944 type:complete len:231 (-) Transcript_26323:1283-1975(-)